MAGRCKSVRAGVTHGSVQTCMERGFLIFTIAYLFMLYHAYSVPVSPFAPVNLSIAGWCYYSHLTDEKAKKQLKVLGSSHTGSKWPDWDYNPGNVVPAFPAPCYGHPRLPEREVAKQEVGCVLCPFHCRVSKNLQPGVDFWTLCGRCF